MSNVKKYTRKLYVKNEPGYSMKGGEILSKDKLRNTFRGTRENSMEHEDITKDNFDRLTANHKYELHYLIGNRDSNLSQTAHPQTAQVFVRTYLSNGIYYMAFTINALNFKDNNESRYPEQLSDETKARITPIWKEVIQDVIQNVYEVDNADIPDQLQYTVVFSSTGVVSYDSYTFRRYKKTENDDYLDNMIAYLNRVKEYSINENLTDNQLQLPMSLPRNEENLVGKYETESAIKARLTTLDTQIAAAEKKVDEAKKEVDEAKKEVDEAKKKVDEEKLPDTVFNSLKSPSLNENYLPSLNEKYEIAKTKLYGLLFESRDLNEKLTKITDSNSDGTFNTEPSPRKTIDSHNEPHISPHRDSPAPSSKQIAAISFRDALSNTAVRAVATGAPIDTPIDTPIDPTQAKLAMTKMVLEKRTDGTKITESVFQNKDQITIIVPVTIDFDKQTLYYDMDNSFFLDC